jgi:hypothetical protein
MSLNGVHHIAQHNVKAVRENRKRFIHVLRWAVRNFRGYFNADSDSDGFPVNTECWFSDIGFLHSASLDR